MTPQSSLLLSRHTVLSVPNPNEIFTCRPLRDHSSCEHAHRSSDGMLAHTDIADIQTLFYVVR